MKHIEIARAILSLPTMPRLYFMGFMKSVRLKKERAARVQAFCSKRLEAYHKGAKK